MPSPHRPPDCVVLVARVHWVVGGTILFAVAVLHALTRNLRAVEFGQSTYVITLSLAGLYLLAGTLVWFGTPMGRFLSRICALLYLARPKLGSYLWEIMNSDEFKAHFGVEPPGPPL